MDTREELHAVLDEFDGDKLPAPEVFRRALQQAAQETRSELLKVLAGRENVGLAFHAMLDSAEATKSAQAALELSAPDARELAIVLLRYVEAEEHAEIRRLVSRQLPQTDRPPVQGVTEQAQPTRTARKLPRSLGMGKSGPPDLSEREGFAPFEDGHPR
jgi:hypothetical protein